MFKLRYGSHTLWSNSASKKLGICLLILAIDAVDGRNPKQPTGLYKTLQVIG